MLPGPSPSAGLNAMIPYEPWNQDIVGTITNRDYSKSHAYYIQFIAPTTGYYTKARMLGGNALAVFPGAGVDIGMCIYDNSGTILPGDLITGERNHGVPYTLKGEGFWTPANFLEVKNQYMEITFNNPIDLVANELYWFGFGWTGPAPGPYPFWPHHADYDASYNSVLQFESTTALSTAPAFKPEITSTDLASFVSSEAACWFHLCDPSSSFLVGPPGPTGPPGGAGSSSLTHVYFGAHFDPSGTNNLKASQFYFLYPGFGGQYDPQFPNLTPATNLSSLFLGGSAPPGPLKRPVPVANIPFTNASTVGAGGTGTGQISWTINNLAGAVGSGLGLNPLGTPVEFRIIVYSYCTTNADGFPNPNTPPQGTATAGSGGTGVDCGVLQLSNTLTWTNQVGNIRNGISVAISPTSDVDIVNNPQTPRTISMAIPLEVSM